GPLKSALGIHSPSRVFMEIGGYTMKGLEIGLSNTQGVKGAVDSLGKELAATTLPAPRVSSSTTRASAIVPAQVTPSPVSQMSAADRMFFRELFQEFAGSLTVTDGVIAQAANAANARLVKAGVR
ncbi:MAG: phage tail tape measure protein, partial [Leifsonia sp.]|nr:phage tail tape measure protein [Leifsonia sp.]